MKLAVIPALALLVLLPGCGPSSVDDSEKASGAAAQSVPNTAAGVTTPAVAAPAEPELPDTSNWSYNETKDEMRGTTTKFATAESVNELELGFPYGSHKAQLMLRRRPSDGLNIMLQIEGQFVCNEYNQDHVSVKFDDGPIRTFSCSEPSGGGAGTLFINGETKFLAALKDADRVTIEAPIYEAGNKQLTFNVAGLQF